MNLESFSRATFECIHFAEHAPDLSGAENAGLKIYHLDSRAIHSETDFFQEIGHSMNFPDYFGHNWDALEECLRDMSWDPARGYVLFLHEAQSLWTHNTLLAGRLTQSWLFCAEEWAHANIPFHLVFLIQ